MIPVTTLAGRRVAVFGLARSGVAAARALAAGGAEPCCWDDGEKSRARATAEGLPMVDLTAADWSQFAALVLAPGVPLTHPKPHWTVERARAAGVEVIGDTELFFRERARRAPAVKVVGITGTNGKSTTTALTAHLLRSAGLRVAMGGNIGEAVLGLPDLAETDAYVVELSSYQIDLTPSVAPDAAALLNVTPDHLDRHGDIATYASVKARIFAGARPSDTAVVGVDDDWCRAIADRLEGRCNLVRISVAGGLADGIVGRDGRLWECRAGVERECAVLEGNDALRGAHNWQNAAAAWGMATGLGIDPARLREGLRTFPGLAHRMQVVGRVGGVLFVNDSKATNADAAAKALAAYDRIHWIAGGLAKEGGIADLAPWLGRIRKAYLIGKATDEFAATLEGRVPCARSGTLAAAVEAAARAALAEAAGGGPPPVVLLSPACASFDQFADFEERGNRFRDLVRALPGIETAARGGA